MHSPTRLDLAGIIGKSPIFYADWLRAGLADFLFGSRRRTAFVGAELFIGRQESLTADLAEIAATLSEPDRIAFGAGCARALAELDWDRDEDAAIAEVLIRLSAMIPAYSVLQTLAAKSYVNIRARAADRLYGLIFDVVEKLAGPAHPEATDCIVSIIHQLGDKFPVAQVRSALLALAASAPDRLADHMRLLATPLEQVYGYHVDPADESSRVRRRRELILDVSDRVPSLDALLAASEAGLRDPGIKRYRADISDWWSNALLTDDDAEVVMLREQLLKRANDVNATIAGERGTDKFGDASWLWSAIAAPLQSKVAASRAAGVNDIDQQIIIRNSQLGDPWPLTAKESREELELEGVE